jgi:hypothetical protein
LAGACCCMGALITNLWDARASACAVELPAYRPQYRQECTHVGA